jgi:predicted ArsR family transcriptional regulator
MGNIQLVTTVRPDTRRHRALSSQSRVDLLAALRGADHPLTVTEAAAQVGLHPNTARVHLEHLVEVGLVARRREDRVQPGRPKTLYAAVGSARDQDAAEGEDYKTLASLLARELGATPDAGRAAVEAGRRWAEAERRNLSDAPGSPAPTAERAVDDVVRIMDGLGFRPVYDPDGSEILLRRCPFEEVARESRAVVCGVHLGLVEGTLEQLGGAVRVRALESFRQDDPLVCAIRLDSPGAG